MPDRQPAAEGPDAGADGAGAAADGDAVDPDAVRDAAVDPLPDAEPDTATVLADLRAARTAYEAADDRVTEHGTEELETVQGAVRRADRLLERYEDSATGTGDFEAYVEFQSAFADLVEELPENLPGRDAFEAADDAVDGRRLSKSDFAAAREALAPARELAALLADREEARETLREAEHDAVDRVDALAERIEDLERLVELSEADLEAPTEKLREPVADYDAAVEEAFASFRREASARAFLRFHEEAAGFPLVDVRAPPPELLAYVEEYSAGEESVETLLEYADYSASKLDHYVDDPGAFSTRVSVHLTYLKRRSAEPLTVGWPPPPAGELRRLGSELVTLTAKFADESVVARAREVRRLATREDYDRLRRAAEAEAELSPDERERVASGAVAEELAVARERRETLERALAEGEG